MNAEDEGENVPPAIASLVKSYSPAVLGLMEEVNLSRQDIVRFPLVVPRFFTGLRYLNVSGNKMRRFPSAEVVEGLPGLVTLDLSRNSLVVLRDVQVLSGLKNLEILNVLENPLPHLDQRILLLKRLIYDQIARNKALFEKEAKLRGEEWAAEQPEDTGLEPRADYLAQYLSRTASESDSVQDESASPWKRQTESAKRLSDGGNLHAGSTQKSRRAPRKRDPDIICTARLGVTNMFHLNEGNDSPSRITRELRGRLGDNTSVYADMRPAPVPRKGPFPRLQTLNELPITINDLDLAEVVYNTAADTLMDELAREEKRLSRAEYVVERGERTQRKAAAEHNTGLGVSIKELQHVRESHNRRAPSMLNVCRHAKPCHRSGQLTRLRTRMVDRLHSSTMEAGYCLNVSVFQPGGQTEIYPCSGLERET